jgi:hypothetical protein
VCMKTRRKRNSNDIFVLMNLTMLIIFLNMRLSLLGIRYVHTRIELVVPFAKFQNLDTKHHVPSLEPIKSTPTLDCKVIEEIEIADYHARKWVSKMPSRPRGDQDRQYFQRRLAKQWLLTEFHHQKEAVRHHLVSPNDTETVKPKASIIVRLILESRIGPRTMIEARHVTCLFQPSILTLEEDLGLPSPISSQILIILLVEIRTRYLNFSNLQNLLFQISENGNTTRTPLLLDRLRLSQTRHGRGGLPQIHE